MKKILVSIFLSLFVFTSAFASYTPTEQDKKAIAWAKELLKNFTEEKRTEIKNKIPLILAKLDVNSKNYFLVSEIQKLIFEIENENLLKDLLNTNKTENIPELYEVVTIIDWDSFHYKKGNETIKARLIWVDAPESTTSRYWYVEPYWVEATEKLKELIGNNKITIEYDETQGKTDKYWRELVYIFINWRNINEEMVRTWFAKEYTYKTKYKYQDIFKKAEEEAKLFKKWIYTEIKIEEPKKEDDIIKSPNYNNNYNYNSWDNYKSYNSNSTWSSTGKCYRGPRWWTYTISKNWKKNYWWC